MKVRKTRTVVRPARVRSRAPGAPRTLVKQRVDRLDIDATRLFRHSPDACFVIRDGAIVACNDAACVMFGRNRGQLVGHAPDEFAPERQPDGSVSVGQARIRVGQVLETGGARFDFCHQRPDGSLFWTEVACGRVDRGRRAAVLASLRDVSERYSAASKQSELETRFAATFEQAAVGMAHVGLDGRWLRVNQRLCRIVGYSRDELLVRTFQDITHPDDLDADLAYVRRLLAGEIDQYSMEKRYVRSDGAHVWIELTVSLVRSASGEPLYFISVIEDISARKAVQSELHIKDAAFENSLASHSIADAGGIIRYVNRAFLKLWGYPDKTAAIGQNVGSFFVNPADAGPVLQALATADKWEGEFLARRADGGVFVSRGYATSMRDDRGTLVGYQSTNLDVTPVRDAERRLVELNQSLVRSNRDLEQFAYVASHDLQEPLRMVSSYTQLLSKRYMDRLDSDANDFIGFAVEGATRMQRLIRDLLQFSRVATTGQQLAPVDSCIALGDAVRNLQGAIVESSGMVTNGDLPIVQADLTQLTQLFQNLIANGLKFRRPGVAPRVHVDARRDSPEPNMWVFSVTDNGIGIEARHHERLFVIFSRLNGRDQYPGTGIGLALCKRIVERHGGRVWLESTPGSGSTFHFTVRDANGAQGDSDGSDTDANR